MAAVTVSVLIALAMPWLMQYVTPGFSGSERDMATTLGRIMMLSPLFLGLSSIVSAVVQSFRKFFVFALSPIFYNLGIIFGIFVFLPALGLPGLAGGVILGAILHLLVQFSSFKNMGFKIFMSPVEGGQRFFKLSAPLKKILKLSLPRVIAASINNLTAVVLVALASTLVVGSITVFEFANNLAGLPIGIFGVSFAVAAFPSLSESFLKKDLRNFTETFYESLHSVLFWMLPASVLFYVLRAQIVRVTLGAGSFDWVDTRLTTATLGILTVFMAANSLVPLLLRAFYALEDTKKPLFINVVAAFLTVIFSLFFIGVMKSSNFFSDFLVNILRVIDVRQVPVLGIALGVSLGSLFNLAWLVRGVKQSIRLKFGIDTITLGESVWGQALKMFVAAILGGIAAFWILRLVNLFVTLETFLGVLTQGFFALAAGLVIYGVILYILGNKEIIRVMEVIKKNMLRLKVLPKELGE